MWPKFLLYRVVCPRVSREEALANIKEAIEGWLEVMETKQ